MHKVRSFLRRLRLGAALAFSLAATSGPGLTAACGGDSSSGPSCCKVCTTGKACGDTCIPATDTCHQAPGCACNG